MVRTASCLHGEKFVLECRKLGRAERFRQQQLGASFENGARVGKDTRGGIKCLLHRVAQSISRAVASL